MKSTHTIIACLLCIAFIISGCAKKDPDPDPPPGPSTSLNGYWDRGDIIVTPAIAGWALPG